MLRLVFPMIRSRLLASALGLTLGLVAVNAAAQATETAAQPAITAPAAERASPPLIVTVVVDQLSANLVNQYRSQFTGGLQTLADQGMAASHRYHTPGRPGARHGH